MAIESPAERRLINLVVTFLPYGLGFAFLSDESQGRRTAGVVLIVIAASLSIFILLFGGEIPKRQRSVGRLSGAPVGQDLRQVHFIGKDLTKERLAWADLTRANLTGAKLAGVDLTGANLTGAVFTGADLGGANLTEANITGADLQGANLEEAVLSGARWDPRRPPVWPEGYDPPARGEGSGVRNIRNERFEEGRIGLSFESVMWIGLALFAGVGVGVLLWRL